MSKDISTSDFSGTDSSGRENSRLKIINALAIKLISITDQNDLAWYVAREVVGNLGFDDCVIYYSDQERQHIRQIAAIGAKNPKSDEILNVLEFPIGEGITGKVAMTGEPMIVNDLKNSDLYIPDIEAALSEICVPLIHGNVILGVIDCESPEPDHFTAEDLEVLTTIAAMVAAKLQLIQQDKYLETLTELQAVQRRFKGFTETASDWYWELDENLCYSFFSSKMEQDENYANSFLLGKHITEIRPHKVDDDRWQRHLEDLSAHRPFRNFIEWITTSNGDKICQSLNGNPWFDEQGSFRGYRGTGTDITSLKQAEEELENSYHELEKRVEQRTAELNQEIETRHQIESDLLETKGNLDDAIESLTGGFAFYDADDRFVLSNKAFLEYPTEYNGPSLVGKTFEEVAHIFATTGAYGEALSDADEFVKDRTTRHRSGQVVELQAKNGDWFEIQEFITHAGGIALIRTNITERKKSEEALKKSDQQLREVLENSPIGVGIVTHSQDAKKPTGERLFVNKALVEMFAAGSHEELLAADISSSWVDHDQLQAAEKIMQSGQGLVDFEARRRRLNGELWWVSMNSRSIIFDGQPCTMNWHSDITERKRVEAEIIDNQEQLERRVEERTHELVMARNEAESASKLKSQLITTMSHELRTPLTSIVGSLRLLASGTVELSSEGATNLLNIASRNSDHLAVLVNDILDLERLQSGTMEMTMQPLDLAWLVQEAVTLNAGYGEEHGVTILASDMVDNVEVMGDEARLFQVMANLISNAAKFSSKGGKVTISLIPTATSARVSVADNGVGIPGEIRNKIFDEFVRGNNVDHRNTNGIGLGLSITKSIIERHDGLISFDTQTGVGTTFYFTLPTL